jgi:hypothetical protein
VKLIPLTGGKFSVVDDVDFDSVNRFKWCHTVNGSGADRGYAVRRRVLPSGKVTRQYLHQFILGVTRPYYVDHKNGNPLDNQRVNLRICTQSQNMGNAKKRKNVSSKFKGVSFYKSRGKWEAYIKANGVFVKLGYFATEIEAAKAYDNAAIANFGEFAKTNKDLGLL